MFDDRKLICVLIEHTDQFRFKNFDLVLEKIQLADPVYMFGMEEIDVLRVGNHKREYLRKQNTLFAMGGA